MKIIKDGYVYVQLEDINYLLGKDNIPRDVLESFGLIEARNCTRYHFIKITEKAAMKYIEYADCIEDYDKLNGKSPKELSELIDVLNSKIEEAKKDLYEATKPQKAKMYSAICCDLTYRRSQVETFYDLRQGLISDIEFPSDVKPPKKPMKNIFKMIIDKFKKDE